MVELYGTVSDIGLYPSMVCPWVENGNLTKYLVNHDSNLSVPSRMQIVSALIFGTLRATTDRAL